MIDSLFSIYYLEGLVGSCYTFGLCLDTIYCKKVI